jgi:CheY-like chemotaxis protein
MMRATVSSARPTVLVIHDDGASLDTLTRLFEAAGWDVVTAITGFRAQAHLESDRKIDVVVAPWDLQHPVGGDVYRWSLQRRYDLRDLFVFLTDSEPPPEFDRIVAGRCLALSLSRPGEVVRVALATLRRAEHLEQVRNSAALTLSGDKPTLLIAEDEPVLLAVMGELLSEIGYAVTMVESGNAAIARMDLEDFDVVVADWHMDDGNGGDLFRWVLARKPYLASRVVFLSGDASDDVGRVAPGRPMFRKGQDATSLLDVLAEIVREVRGDRQENEPAVPRTISTNDFTNESDTETVRDDTMPVEVVRIKPDPIG